jgi:hypothetical protein
MKETVSIALSAVILVVGLLIYQGIIPMDSTMRQIFNDDVNLMLLVAIVGLAIYADHQSGLVGLFIILLLSVKYRGTQEGFAQKQKRIIEKVLPPVKERFATRAGVRVVDSMQNKQDIYDTKMQQADEGSTNLTADSEPLDETSERTYDIVGCKFNEDGKPVNASMYGPPLNSCGGALQSGGTVFYPLHA